ncbi:hypothetical protein HPB47_020895 [Ixodes persulcatus]|uniref:Uncharacterized protein n=1 Tax=Ixodes persulcatus TaxID=34615 RepID=A0AC60QED2_IXOPE|nr:hypothetical protein HPB47_020895 [Ixodes persulcatus]
MTCILFESFLQYLDSQMGLQNRKTLLLIDNCLAQPKDLSVLGNVRVQYLPPQHSDQAHHPGCDALSRNSMERCGVLAESNANEDSEDAKSAQETENAMKKMGALLTYTCRLTRTSSPLNRMSDIVNTAADDAESDENGHSHRYGSVHGCADSEKGLR